MPAPPTSVQSIARDAAWLPHRYDPVGDTVHFRHVPRELHRSVTFLTDDYLPEDRPRVIRRAAILAHNPSNVSPHFIFHSAYCCSTLLARAMDVDGMAMGLKEPVILNDLVGWRRRGGEARQVSERLHDALLLLARPFGPGEGVVIKPSNTVNGMADAMLTMRPESRALFLYAPLSSYLRSIARKDMWGRLWVRKLLIGQMKDNFANLGFSNEDYFGLTDLQVAAIGWLNQHHLFHRLVRKFGANRVATLDSDTLLARPADALAALTTLFRLPIDDDGIAAICAGPAFSRHSKSGENFTGQERRADQLDAAKVHGDEIDKVEQWAAAVSTNAGLSAALGARLIS